MSGLRDHLADMASDDLFGEEKSAFDKNAVPKEGHDDIDYDPRAAAIAQGVFDPHAVGENRPTAPRVTSGQSTGSLIVESSSRGGAQPAIESPKPDGELQTSDNILSAPITTDATNPIVTPPEKGASSVLGAEIDQHGTVGTSSRGLGKFHRGNVATRQSPGSHHVQSSISRPIPARRPISARRPIVPAASPKKKRNNQPSGPGSSSRVAKSKKHAHRASKFPWKYRPHVNFNAGNALAGPSNSDPGMELDEGEPDEESSGDFFEEPSPPSPNPNHPVIDLTHDDDDADEFYSDSLPLNSAQIASSAGVQQPGFSYPPAAFNYAPPPAAPHHNIPALQTATRSTPSSMYPNAPSPLRMGYYVNAKKSPDPGPGSSRDKQKNATTRKSQPLESSPSVAPIIERNAERPPHDPSPNEQSDATNLNLHVRMGQPNMHPSSHAPMGPQHVKTDFRMQARLQMLNADIHINIEPEEIHKSDYMMFRVPELKKLMKDRHIPRHGVKRVLIRRLMESDARQIVIAQGLVQQLPQRRNVGPVDGGGSRPSADSAYGMQILNHQPSDAQGRQMPPVHVPGAGAYAQMGFNNAAQPSIHGNLGWPVNGGYLRPVNGGPIVSHHQRLQALKAYLFQPGANSSPSHRVHGAAGGDPTNSGTPQPRNGKLVGRANGLPQYSAPGSSRGPPDRVAQPLASEDIQRTPSGLPQGLMHDPLAGSASPGPQQPADGNHGRNINRTAGLDRDDPLGLDVMPDMDQTLADLMRVPENGPNSEK